MHAASISSKLLQELGGATLVGPLIVSRIAALFSALYLAANPTFWSQSLIAEVYPLYVVFLLLIAAGYSHQIVVAI